MYAVPRARGCELYLDERVKDPVLVEVAVVVALRGDGDERLGEVVSSRSAWRHGWRHG
jgi:hypothetical protein